MATITPTPASANTTVTFTAASAGGDTIACGPAQRTILMIRNASGGSITVTLTAVNACSQGVLHNIVITCAIGDTDIAIPASCITTQGNCAITYSAVTSITVAAVTN